MRRRPIIALLLLLSLLTLAAERMPWRARKRPDFQPNRLASERVRIDEWGQEPEAPQQVAAEPLARALAELCAYPTPKRALPLAQFTLEAAAEFAIDPFLLGALAYRASRCRSDKQELAGIGLSLLPPRMYEADFRGRSYHYRVRDKGEWHDRVQPLPRYAFVPGNLLRAQSNLYFTAGLLAMWRDQHATVDEGFPQLPHRHFVSHFVWGDSVQSARAEDRILSDRRRLLGYYGALPAQKTIRYRGHELGSPLDGAPRVVSSGLGFARDGGRTHRGIDVESEFGETVRAIAGGKVVFSGVDLPGQREHLQLSTAATNAYDRKALGFGGRYVCISHDGGEGALRSCSMHLETVRVGYGERVERGQPIGTVGRTGMKSSSPHLHLELLEDAATLLDGLQVMRGVLIGTPLELDDLDYSQVKVTGIGNSTAF